MVIKDTEIRIILEEEEPEKDKEEIDHTKDHQLIITKGTREVGGPTIGITGNLKDILAI